VIAKEQKAFGRNEKLEYQLRRGQILVSSDGRHWAGNQEEVGQKKARRVEAPEATFGQSLEKKH